MSGIFALERIAFQKDDFVTKLEAIISAIQLEVYEDKRRDFDDSPLVEKMEKLIFDRFGISVEIFSCREGAAVVPLYVNKHHVFASKNLRSYKSEHQDRFISTLENRRGNVDDATAKVSGAFSEYRHKFFIHFSHLTRRFSLTAGELAAVVIHEIGHAYNALYFSNRFDSINQVLANMMRQLTNKNKPVSAEYLLTDINKITKKITKEDVDELLNGGPTAKTTQALRLAVEVGRSMMQLDSYDRTANEEYADSFASRFGKGKDLAIALQKINQNESECLHALWVINHIAEVSKVLVLFSFTIIGALAAIFLPLTLLTAINTFLILSFAWGLRGVFSDNAESSLSKVKYDSLKNRFERLRRQAIEILKEGHLDKATAAKTLENINELDEIINKTKNPLYITGLIGNFIFKSSREAVKTREMQQMLESLGNNEMFVHSEFFNQKA